MQPGDPHEQTFDALVEPLRSALAELEPVEHELDPPTRDFVRGIRAALEQYDAEAEPEPGGIAEPGTLAADTGGGWREPAELEPDAGGGSLEHAGGVDVPGGDRRPAPGGIRYRGGSQLEHRGKS